MQKIRLYHPNYPKNPASYYTLPDSLPSNCSCQDWKWPSNLDYSSSMSNMGTVDLNKINQKIQEIRMELENVRDSVLNAMGIPGDIFTGRATKWEALKTSERLNSRINFYVSMLKSSIAEAAKIVILNIYDDELDPDSIEVHMFSKTTVEI